MTSKGGAAVTSAAATRDRIVAEATRLFAERGYDGTSTRMIADAAGLNIATVAYHVGGKRDLYLEVMERAQRAEWTALSAAVEEFRSAPDPVAGMCLLVDRYLDFCAADPRIPALWMRRWLSDAPDIVNLERRHVVPVFGMVAEALEAVIPSAESDADGEDVDLEYAIWSIVWCIHGFCQGGVLGADGTRRRAGDHEALARVRAHLHCLVHRLFR